MRTVLFCCLIVFQFFGFSQSRFVVQNKKGKDRISFQLINNLIIIPVKVNGVELSFLLDTGVSKPIIFNFLNLKDSLEIKKTEKIFLRGLGDGDAIEAIKSQENIMQIGDAINMNQDLYIVYYSRLNFAPKLGFPLHGIIGYDLMKDLIVEINYSSKYLRLTNHENYYKKPHNKSQTLDLTFHNNKPYIKAKAKFSVEENSIPVKLLIDTGGSDALWLFEDSNVNIINHHAYFEDFLGHGLSGSVYGKRSRLHSFMLSDYEILNSNVSYPDTSSISFLRRIKDRNGSISGNILKRFNWVFDYSNSKIFFKKNKYFNEKFSYNKSGIELEHNGMRLISERQNYNSAPRNNKGREIIYDSKEVLVSRYRFVLKPAFTITELRQNSPAEKAGLKIDDVILSINGKAVDGMALQDVMMKFYDKEGKEIKLEIDRNGENLKFKFSLEKVIE